MSTLRAYGDESGLHDGAPCFVLAGWAAKDDVWTALDGTWKETLQDAGLQAGQAFHMTDFAAGRRAFEGWNAERRTDLVKALADALLATPALGAGVIIDRKKADGMGLGGHWFSNEPYSAAMPLFLGAVALQSMTRFGAEQQIDIVLDRQKIYADSTLKIFNEMRTEPEGAFLGFGSLTFEESAQHAALQAADMLAFELRKEYESLAAGGTRPRRRLLERLLEGERVLVLDITGEAGSLDQMLRAKWRQDASLPFRIGLRPGSSKKVSVPWPGK